MVAPIKLRNFGLFLAVFMACIFGIAIPYFYNTEYPTWPWIVAPLLVTLSLFLPKTLRPLFVASTLIGQIMGKVTTPIILGTLFYAVFFPFGYIYRFVGKTLLQPKIRPELKSYRNQSTNQPRNHFERPF
jgi:hypothetical protein